jgi:hypothetical protein
MINIVRAAIIALVVALAALAPQAALAANTFYGIAQHVSLNNIKVYDPKTHQALSFVIFPKFDQIFSADGKTTYEMKDIKAGRYVGVIYDQKALGARHADKIFLLTNANQKIAEPVGH